MTKNKFDSFKDFYPYYLTEHDNIKCRSLHYLGSTLVLALAIGAVLTKSWGLLWLLPIMGYGPAWTGHFFFEKNKPATFQYPLYSFLSDWVMLKDAVTGELPNKLQMAKQTFKINT
jgi:hypothetical protein